VKMLGILGNFGKEDSYEAIKSIVNEMQSFAKSDFAESRYFEQLRIFVQLRGNVKQQFLKVMESVSKFFKEEDDFLFEKGEVKGREIERIEMIRNMIVKLGFSDEQIANTFEMPIDFVKSVRKRLQL